MNKYNEIIDELEGKLDRIKQKVKSSKVICKNNLESSKEIVFAHNVYGTNKSLAYEIDVFGTQLANIVVKIDDVVVSAINGMVACGEILLKAHKLYSLAVICTGEGMLAAKLKLDATDLRVN